MTEVDAIISSSLPKKYKLVVLGDQSVGKTSLIKRFVDDAWNEAYSPTVGIDFLCKTVYLENMTVRLQMWDTAGQERFKSLIPSYIRDSSIALIVYDITNRKSFLNSFHWLREVRQAHGKEIVVGLVGNKTDLNKERVVSFEELKNKAQENECIYLETSAKSGSNVKKLFYDVASSIPLLDKKEKKSEEYFVVPLKTDADGEGGTTSPSNEGYCSYC